MIKAVPAEEDEEALLHSLGVATEIALQNIINMRAAEGERLAKDILMRADIIEEIKDKIKERAPEIGKEYADKFRERVNELLEGKLEVPEERAGGSGGICGQSQHHRGAGSPGEPHSAAAEFLRYRGRDRGQKNRFLDSGDEPGSQHHRLQIQRYGDYLLDAGFKGGN